LTLIGDFFALQPDKLLMARGFRPNWPLTAQVPALTTSGIIPSDFLLG
jgi:hypothetical protein